MVPTSTVQDAKGWAALHFAIDRQLPEVVELLIKHNADINLQDADGWAAIHFAIDRQLPEVVELLIKHNADISRQTKRGETPLHFAVRKMPDFVNHLVDSGADILMKNDDGDDAITSACLKGRSDVVSILLHAAKPGIKKEVEADELLGCYFAQAQNDHRRAFNRWQAAYEKRVSHNIPMPVTVHQYEVFADVEEIRTLEYLNSLRNDPDKIFLQSLLIQQRILGTNDTDLADRVEKNAVRSYLPDVSIYMCFNRGVTERTHLVSNAA